MENLERPTPESPAGEQLKSDDFWERGEAVMEELKVINALPPDHPIDVEAMGRAITERNYDAFKRLVTETYVNLRGADVARVYLTPQFDAMFIQIGLDIEKAQQNE